MTIGYNKLANRLKNELKEEEDAIALRRESHFLAYQNVMSFRMAYYQRIQVEKCYNIIASLRDK